LEVEAYALPQPPLTICKPASVAAQDDGLEAYFGLPERQLRRILNDLRAEKLVCDEDITERRVRKRGVWEARGI
jgi:transcription initiation factor IIE alpha subunit